MKRNLLQRLLLVCSLLGIAFAGLNAQQTYACVQPGNPVPPGATKCTSSCIYCNLDGLTDNNNQTLPTPQTNFCLTLENPRWYGFIAGTTNIAFLIKPTSSTTGNGLEAMVTSDCSTILGCTPGVAGNGTNPITVFLYNLTVGNAYQLCIDGNLGDVCKYTISVPSGSTIPPPMGAIGTIQGLKQVCPNGTVTYTIPPVDNAISYLWTAPAGSSINGGSNSMSVPAPGGTSVQIKFGSVGGTVCVAASNACSSPVSTCITVTNKALAIVDLPPVRVCNEALPYVWPEQPNNLLIAPGTYTLKSDPYPSYLGCDSIVRQTITILPLKIKNLSPIFLCHGQCYSINGNQYCDSGSYAETLTTDDGCDSLVNFTLQIVQAKAVIPHPEPTDTITCLVTSIPLTSAGSTTGNTVTYNWTNGAWQTISTTGTATATSADTTYHLIVSNYMGGIVCRDTATIKIPNRVRPPQVNAGPPLALGCVTQTTLHGFASHGSQYTYLWVASAGGNIVSGANTLTPIVNAVGTYKLYVTNTHTGCTNVSTTHVTESTTPPTVTLTGATLTCRDTLVRIHSMIQGGTGGGPGGGFTTVSWTGPNNYTSNNPNPRVKLPGDYTIVVTNLQNGCTATATVTVTQDITQPDVAAFGGSITCIADTVTLNGHSEAAGAKFAWSGPSGFIDSLVSTKVTTAGDYTLVVTGGNGCTNSATTSVVVNNTLPGAALTASGNLNCNNATINLLASSTASGANLNHVWTTPGNTTDTTGTTPLLVAGAAGTYNLVVTNTVNGCTSTASIAVIKHDPVATAISAQSNISCFGAGNGQLTAAASGGDANYTYTWSNTATGSSLNSLGAGTYTVTVSDSENCTAIASASITQPTQLVSTSASTPQTGVGLTDGTATVNPTGGTPGYTYLWSNGQTTQSISGLNPGLYTATITDQNGCTDVQTASVNPYNCTNQASSVVQNVGCHGGSNGSASISINGGTMPFTYDWSNGTHDPVATNLSPGTYTVSITDAASCVVAVSFTISQPDTLLANVNATPSSGPTTNNGVAATSPTGGNSPYTYSWSTGASTATINNLAGGTYTVTVIDAKGCIAVQSTVIGVGHCGVVNSFLVTNLACNGNAGGAATVVLTGGFPPFTYKWSSGGTNAAETGLQAGTYKVSITDVKGCQIVDSTSLTQPTLLTATVSAVTNTVCKNAPDGAISLTAAGGTGTPTVLWSDGEKAFSISNLVSGSYTATVTDANGCTTTASAQVQFSDPVPPTIQVAAVDTVNLGSSGTITLTAQNLNAIIADNCEIANVTISPNKYTCSDIGNHQVTITVTDDSGNTSSQTVTVVIVDHTPPTLTCPSSVVRCFGDDVVLYNAPTALDNCLALGGSFNLSSGLPSGSTFPLGTTTTTYTFTDSQGNIGSCSFDVTILSQLKVKVDTVIDDLNNQHIGSIHITVTGGLSPYEFAWTENGNVFPDSVQQLLGLGQGNYHVVVTDVYGCTAESGTITVKATTATDNPEWINEIGIYPNPTTGNVTVVLPDELTDKAAQLAVYDETGRKLIDQSSTQEKQVNLDLSLMANGIYFLRLQVNANQVIRKIVVQR